MAGNWKNGLGVAPGSTPLPEVLAPRVRRRPVDAHAAELLSQRRLSRLVGNDPRR